MKKSLLAGLACLTLGVSSAFAGASGYKSSAFGYGAGATGGGSASPTLVTSASALESALTASGSKVIIITKDITVTNHISVLATNKTLLAVKGVKLISAQQNKDKSGILYFKKGSSNIILRNLTFVGPGAYDCDGWDNLCFDGVTKAWVDHCDFQDGCDGNFDNKGLTDNIT
ncbi:MAG: chromophore lyase, partial [Prevotella sp.]|nr:chromophore lyase [Prevotella sp.]